MAHIANHKEAYHVIAYLIGKHERGKIFNFREFYISARVFIFHQHRGESNIGFPLGKVYYYGPLSIYLEIVHKIFRV